MSLKNDIESRFLQAMKAKDAETTSVLRVLRAALKNFEIEKMTKEATDEQVVEVVGREVKKIKDALVDFEKAGREDLASKTKKELEYLSGFLPAPLEEAEVREYVKAKAKELGLAGEAAFGRLMGEAMKGLEGKAEGTLVSKAVKEALQDTA
jgi:hypothetical protein